ncbi:uncharacterized protein slow isoform X2 [Chelonus insularis]|uniref:uncharacterized protein slow isoform X2 n=1 Tax=Chelonus insularis TaxID=460826 RepID=UPI00158D846D|nr:uncharacterized protein LOC118069762 isoform X2 [Chelonus insularis]
MYITIRSYIAVLTSLIYIISVTLNFSVSATGLQQSNNQDSDPQNNHRTNWPLWHRHQGRRSFHHSRVHESPLRVAKSHESEIAEYSGTRAVAYAGYHGDRATVGPRDAFNVGFTTTTAPYSRHHTGRRVCTRQIPTVNHHYSDRQIRFYYAEVATSSFICCPGWSQVTRTSYGCNRPTCVAPCHNGGVCGPHGKCNCPKGFTGSQCQIDVDECITEKPCAQICRNLPGSYECHCRYGFQLQPDGQSCRKNDSDGTAFEATDLESDYDLSSTTKRPLSMIPHDTENEVNDGDVNKDYEIIMKRLTKLEKQFARGKRKETEATELSSKVNQAVEEVAELRLAAKNVLHFLRETFGPVRQEVYDMKNKFELEQRRIDHLAQRFAEFDHRLNLQRSRVIDG